MGSWYNFWGKPHLILRRSLHAPLRRHRTGYTEREACGPGDVQGRLSHQRFAAAAPAATNVPGPVRRRSPACFRRPLQGCNGRGRAQAGWRDRVAAGGRPCSRAPSIRPEQHLPRVRATKGPSPVTSSRPSTASPEPFQNGRPGLSIIRRRPLPYSLGKWMASTAPPTLATFAGRTISPVSRTTIASSRPRRNCSRPLRAAAVSFSAASSSTHVGS